MSHVEQEHTQTSLERNCQPRLHTMLRTHLSAHPVQLASVPPGWPKSTGLQAIDGCYDGIQQAPGEAAGIEQSG